MSNPAESTADPAYRSSPAPAGAAGTRNGAGTAALVIGIVALVTCWTVVGGVVLGILAVVLGFVGRGRVQRGEATNRSSALAGIVVGLAAIVLAVVLVAVGATFFIHHKKAINNLESCLQHATSQAQKNSCNQRFSHSLNQG